MDSIDCSKIKGPIQSAMMIFKVYIANLSLKLAALKNDPHENEQRRFAKLLMDFKQQLESIVFEAIFFDCKTQRL